MTEKLSYTTRPIYGTRRLVEDTGLRDMEDPHDMQDMAHHAFKKFNDDTFLSGHGRNNNMSIMNLRGGNSEVLVRLTYKSGSTKKTIDFDMQVTSQNAVIWSFGPYGNDTKAQNIRLSRNFDKNVKMCAEALGVVYRDLVEIYGDRIEDRARQILNNDKEFKNMKSQYEILGDYYVEVRAGE